jgi:hypothetical protein
LFISAKAVRLILQLKHWYFFKELRDGLVATVKTEKGTQSYLSKSSCLIRNFAILNLPRLALFLLVRLLVPSMCMKEIMSVASRCRQYSLVAALSQIIYYWRPLSCARESLSPLIHDNLEYSKESDGLCIETCSQAPNISHIFD